MRQTFFFLLFLMCASFAHARPVSYPGGWTFITENDGDDNSALMHYTFTPKVAVGYRVMYDRDTRQTFHGVQMNNLIKRWNQPDSQANLYIKSAVGMAEKPEGITGIQADWENRRVMVMYENMAMLSSNDQKRKFHQSLGFGIAPYVAEAGSFHTWIMPHILHQPEDKNDWQFAPMLRFFKASFLVEGGYNVTTDTPIVNAIIRF